MKNQQTKKEREEELIKELKKVAKQFPEFSSMDIILAAAREKSPELQITDEIQELRKKPLIGKKQQKFIDAAIDTVKHYPDWFPAYIKPGNFESDYYFALSVYHCLETINKKAEKPGDDKKE